jgi:hypothetical protein
MYHYHATPDFPYTAGCLRGRYTQADVATISGPRPERGMGRGYGKPSDTGPGSPPNGGPGPSGSPPDLKRAAAALGISAQKLHDALGPPPPDLTSAAAKLGISVEALQSALNAAH